MHNKFFIFDNKKVWTGSANITSTDLTGFNANYVVLIDSSEIANQYLNEFNQMYDGNFHTDKQKFSQIKVNLTNSTNVEVLFSPQDSVIETKLLPLINSAKNYIYIPIFFFTSKEMSDALINAHLRGVDIKIINDATNAHTKYSVHKILRKSGIKVKTENYAGKMHMKSIIIDDKISVLGSMNYTKSANLRNDENILIIYNSEIAKYLKGTFMYLWNKIPDKYLRFDPRAESLESIGSCFDGIDNDFDGKIDSEDEGCNIKQK
jgi:phosphatidylserine/phosphatidylglycerophosphate/cardiolipin synthase-like enzyme